MSQLSTGKHKKIHLGKASTIVAIGTALSRVTGLLREQVIAFYFGASLESDAFFTAFRLPNLLRDMFAEGALSSAFVPVFKERLVKEGEDSAFALANLALSALTIIVGLITLIGMVASPALVYISAYGFTNDPHKFDLTVSMTRIMFPFLLLVSLSSLVMGVVNSFGRFGVSAISSTMFNVGSIICVVLLYSQFNQPVYALAIGVLVGGVGQLAIQLPQLFEIGFRFRPRFDLLHEDLKRIWKLFSPIVIGLSAGRINILVSTLLASMLVEGTMSYLNYSYRLMHFPLGVFAVAIGTVSLPRASEHVARGEFDELGTMFYRSLSVTLALIIPSAVVLALMGKDLIDMIYHWGRFSGADVEGTTRTLFHYSYGLIGFAAVRVIVPIFYALGDAKLPMYISLVTVGVNLLLYYPCIRIFDYAGLAAATSIAALTNTGLLLYFIPKHGIRFPFSDLFLTLFKLIVISVIAVYTARMIPLGFLQMFPLVLERAFQMVLPLLIAGALFIGLAVLLKVEAVGLVAKRIPFLKRFF